MLDWGRDSLARINKAIELLEQGQEIFMMGTRELTYEAGRQMAQTWADMILIDFEHYPFDVVGLAKFMRGLVDGGPTPSGHPTPAVTTTLPSNCITPEEVYYNAWQVRQVLTTGVHGILHMQARSAEAVRAFVATVRYPHHTAGRDRGLPEGRRGQGGQGDASAIWGVGPMEYIRRADPWPLNPEGRAAAGPQNRGPSRSPRRRRHRRRARPRVRRVGSRRHGPVLRRPKPARPPVLAADERGAAPLVCW